MVVMSQYIVGHTMAPLLLLETRLYLGRQQHQALTLFHGIPTLVVEQQQTAVQQPLPVQAVQGQLPVLVSTVIATVLLLIPSVVLAV